MGPATTEIIETAPAKINLCLHVTGQRADGYHLLDSLVAFAGIGDRVSVELSGRLSLRVTGPMAAGVPEDGTNLVWKAACWLAPGRGARIVLEKQLPAAAGIGGGSSDAAAVLRALARLWQVAVPADTSGLGADVPVCMTPRAQRMEGVGERLTPLPALPAAAVLLVNPGVHHPTPAVFRALRQKTNPPLPPLSPFADFAALVRWLAGTRNDLAAPALEGAPVIGRVLETLSSAP